MRLLAEHSSLSFLLVLFALGCDPAQDKSEDTPVAKTTAPSKRAFGPAEAAFQADADTRRLTHLEYYANIIEEYHAKTGRYPLQGRSTKDVEVFVSSPAQYEQMLAWTSAGSPPPTQRIAFSEFLADLEAELGREISEYYDPQIVATTRPNFYIYLLVEDGYFLAVHTSNPFDFATKIADESYKVEVSSIVASGRPPPAKLLADPAFRAALERPQARAEFFDARDAEFLHATRDKAKSE